MFDDSADTVFGISTFMSFFEFDDPSRVVIELCQFDILKVFIIIYIHPILLGQYLFESMMQC